MDLSRQQTELYAKFFRGLSDPTRVRIIELLLGGEKCVGELAEVLGSSQSRVSTHLSCLKDCGYVTSIRRGRNVYYRVTDVRVRDLARLAKEIVASNAEQIAACARMGEQGG